MFLRNNVVIIFHKNAILYKKYCRISILPKELRFTKGTAFYQRNCVLPKELRFTKGTTFTKEKGVVPIALPKDSV